MIEKHGGATATENHCAQADSSPIITELLEGLQVAAEEIAPRFLATMPSAYFHDTDQEMRLTHLKAVIAAEASGVSQTITLRNKERTRYTFISDRSYPGQLSKFVRRLPRERPLYSAQVYTATDGSRVLDVFEVGTRVPFTPEDPQQQAKMARVLDYLRNEDPVLQEDRPIDHFKSCSANYLLTTSPAQIHRHYTLVQRIRDSGNCLVQLGQHPQRQSNSLTIGVIDADRRLLFERITRYLGQQGIDIQRAYLDSFERQGNETVSLLSLSINLAGEAIMAEDKLWSQLRPDLKRLVYLDETVLKLAHDLPDANLLQAEILVTLSHLTHQHLVKLGELNFSRERILQTLGRYPAQAKADFMQVGRAYADALLDLIVPDSKTRRLNNDYLECDELLYLGPDENISNELITWIVERARHRGHPMPDAFMSSKPGAGINHKLYGVTSEGVTVFLEAALRNCGINPRKQRFTIKMTGGPDGDVAGNEIRILKREYGENARILGIADGSGCLEDPDGLDFAELFRLVEGELPVCHFDPARLGRNARLIGIDEAGGMAARNSMHNRIQADAFIPAGGRPRTINDDNWQDFLAPSGEPSSRVIVEGANLFITPEARRQLSRCGVIIINDSSANKCGVICSSYEILASMLLNEAEFLRIKRRFIDDVLVKLRKLAAMEAQTLFREHRHKPDPSLPELSTRLSRVIDRATDAITLVIDTLKDSNHDLTLRLVQTYLPAVLLETAGERFFERIPPAYLTRVIASVLASHIVYREGLDWFEQMPDGAIAALAVRYLHEEVTVSRLVNQVTRSDLPDRERIAELLREGGVAAALRNATLSA